jgi:hypothetical protein
VGRLLGEEHEDRGAHVSARSAPARPEVLTEASGTTEAGGKVRCIEGRPSAAVAVSSAMLEVLADVVVETCGGFVPRPCPVVVRYRMGMFSGHVGSLHGG